MANTAVSDSITNLETQLALAGFLKLNPRVPQKSGNIQHYQVYFAGTEEAIPYGFNSSLLTANIAIELRLSKGSAVEINRDTASGLVEKAIEKLLITAVPTGVVDMKRSVTFELEEDPEALIYNGQIQIIYLETIGA